MPDKIFDMTEPKSRAEIKEVVKNTGLLKCRICGGAIDGKGAQVGPKKLWVCGTCQAEIAETEREG